MCIHIPEETLWAFGSNPDRYYIMDYLNNKHKDDIALILAIMRQLQKETLEHYQAIKRHLGETAKDMTRKTVSLVEMDSQQIAFESYYFFEAFQRN